MASSVSFSNNHILIGWLRELHTELRAMYFVGSPPMVYPNTCIPALFLCEASGKIVVKKKTARTTLILLVLVPSRSCLDPTVVTIYLQSHFCNAFEK